MQVPALRIVAGLLVRWKPNRDAFNALEGYSILLYLLSQSELSFELFQILFDIATHGEADISQRVGSLKDPQVRRSITSIYPQPRPIVVLSNMQEGGWENFPACPFRNLSRFVSCAGSLI